VKNLKKVVFIFLYILFISVLLFKFCNINSNLYNNTNFIDFLANFSYPPGDFGTYFLKIFLKGEFDPFILYLYELLIKIKK
jgi:hypothetical protein